MQMKHTCTCGAALEFTTTSEVEYQRALAKLDTWMAQHKLCVTSKQIQIGSPISLSEIESIFQKAKKQAETSDQQLEER